MKPRSAITSGTHGAHGMLVGLDKHLEVQASTKNTAQPMEENSDRSTSIRKNIEEYGSDKIEGDPKLSTNASQVSQESQLSNDKFDKGH